LKTSLAVLYDLVGARFMLLANLATLECFANGAEGSEGWNLWNTSFQRIDRDALASAAQ
jgi:hypothetical protein